MKVGDLVVLEWRDSFSSHDQTELKSLQTDCKWFSVGWVVRLTDLFITIANGVQTGDTKDTPVQFDNFLSIPHTQVVGYEKVA